MHTSSTDRDLPSLGSGPANEKSFEIINVGNELPEIGSAIAR
jgi:hypothetical protein